MTYALAYAAAFAVCLALLRRQPPQNRIAFAFLVPLVCGPVGGAVVIWIGTMLGGESNERGL